MSKNEKLEEMECLQRQTLPFTKTRKRTAALHLHKFNHKLHVNPSAFYKRIAIAK